jgi:hypothetical protein
VNCAPSDAAVAAIQQGEVTGNGRELAALETTPSQSHGRAVATANVPAALPAVGAQIEQASGEPQATRRAMPQPCKRPTEQRSQCMAGMETEAGSNQALPATPCAVVVGAPRPARD